MKPHITSAIQNAHELGALAKEHEHLEAEYQRTLRQLKAALIACGGRVEIKPEHWTQAQDPNLEIGAGGGGLEIHDGR